VLLVSALLVAGCGGGSDSGSGSSQTATRATSAPPTTAAPTGGAPAPAPAAKKRFIKQADRVCHAARAKLVPLRTKALKAGLSNDPAVVFKQYAALTSQAATVYGQTVGQIRALDVPPADQSEIDRLTALLAQTAGIERQISSAAAAQDGPRIKELALEVNGVVDRFHAGAKAYGFHDCARAAGQALQRRGNR